MIDLKKMRDATVYAEQHGDSVCAFVVLELLDLLEAAQKDAARYQWLVGARTKNQTAALSCTVFNPLPQDRVLHEMQCFFLHKEQADEMIDAAMSSQA